MKKLGIVVTLLSTVICFSNSDIAAARPHHNHSQATISVIKNVFHNRYNMTYNSNEQFSLEVLNLVNAERRKVGARPLRMSSDLMYAASIRARELTENFSHTRPDGSECFSILRDRNRYLGENIAAGQSSPSSVVNSWMHSSGHRANILNARFSEIGIGYCYDGNSEYGHYWVQMFRG